MAPREAWTDERLDEKMSAVDARLDRIEIELRELRRDTNAGFDSLRASIDSLRTSMEAGFESVRGEFTSLRGETERGDASLRGEIERGDASLRNSIDDLRRQMVYAYISLVMVVVAAFLTALLAG